MVKPVTTTVSTKGQIVLPKAVREHWNWRAGVRLTVQETEDGVLLQRAPLFPATRSQDVFGSLKPKGTALSVEEMDAAVAAEAVRRARD